MSTETIDQRYKKLDTWPTQAVANALSQSQIQAANALTPMTEVIASAAEQAAKRLLRDEAGRLIYVGAGASIRIGVQDGVELSPTYNWPLSRLNYLIAGGKKALTESVEGAEDDTADAIAQTNQLNLTKNDVVIAIAASGKTPFTLTAAQTAKKTGALVISCSNNSGSPLAAITDFAIELDTGSEVIAGSTRMAAATGQKIALNMLSTLIMVRLHRVYDNLMVDLASSNHKLNQRRITILQAIIDIDTDTAKTLLEKADQNIKIAALLHSTASLTQATALLTAHQGNLRAALEQLKKV